MFCVRAAPPISVILVRSPGTVMMRRFEVIRDEQMINELIAFVHNNKIDVLSIDPFVATTA